MNFCVIQLITDDVIVSSDFLIQIKNGKVILDNYWKLQVQVDHESKILNLCNILEYVFKWLF